MDIQEKINIIDEKIFPANVLATLSNSVMNTVDSFYILDVRVLLHQHFNFQRLMPRVKPFYAMKCNSNKIVLTILAALGVNFDCASMGEIRTLLSLGVSPDRIAFANPTKLISHIQFAQENNVNLMTFDHENELYKIKKYHPNAKLLLRFRSDSTKVTITLGGKFGCDSDRDVSRILRIAKELSLCVVGVCFHVGTNCQEPSAYYQAFMKARQIFEKAKSFGFHMNILDIGGGFPYNKPITIEQIAEAVNSGLSDFFPQNENITIIAEPGRYYVAPVFTLACRICSNKPNLKGDSFYYYLSDGIYGSFMSLLCKDLDIPNPFTLKTFDYDPQLYQSTIWGPTCDGLDLITSNCRLPKLELDDWLFFDNMGAYTLSVQTKFNNFSPPPVISVADRRTKLFLQTHKISEDLFKGNEIKDIAHSLNISVMKNLSMSAIL